MNPPNQPRLPRAGHRPRRAAGAAAEHPEASAEAHLQAAGQLERLIFLSDGVFAIAMTLLAVELTLPELAAGSVSVPLADRLWALKPKYLSFGISFLVVASYWSSHVRMFRHIVRADDWLVRLNLGLLLCIAFQPFPTNVLGTYGDQTAAVTLYAGTLTVTGLAGLAIWLYATSGRRLVRPDLSQRVVQRQTLRSASIPAVALASISIAQFNPVAAQLSWLVIAVVLFGVRWVYRDKA